MSKQKTLEPENEVTENLELEGLSKTEETPAETVEKPIVDTVVTSGKLPNVKINTVATAKVAANKKMGVYKFLSLYPQDIYIETLLKFYYPHSFYTKDEWFQRIQDILNTPINN